MFKILIYSDQGVSAKSYANTVKSLKALPLNISIKSVDSEELKNAETLKDARLLIIPGGRDLPYVERLKGLGISNIRRWVEEGGAYFGICAGAYFGASYVSFEKGGELEVLGDRDLKFFEGSAVGPALGLRPFRYGSEEGAHAALIQYQGESCYCYFNGGCTFEGKLDDVAVLAHYEELAGRPPAIIQCQVGKGLAILSGVHPEYSVSSLDMRDPYLQAIFPLMEEDARKQLFESLLRTLLT